jgi:hypothetical protein
MPILIIVESTIIVSTIPTFQLELIPLFFHIDSLQEFRDRFKFSNATNTIIVTEVKGGGENSHEKQLMVANGEGEFDQDVLAFGNPFRIEYD